MGGWVWGAVGDALRAKGARYHAPTLTGLDADNPSSGGDVDLNTHIADIVNLCGSLGNARPVLVGHSYGGLVAMGAAERIKQGVSGVVILDGYLVSPGQSAFGGYPEVQGLLAPLIGSREAGFIEPLPMAAFGIDDAQLLEALGRNLRPMPLATHTTALEYSPAVLRDIPRTYVRCSQFPIFEQTAARAAADGWRVAEIDAGHMAVVTHPARVADEILAAAEYAGRHAARTNP